MTARTVDWLAVHQWVTARQKADSWPLIGTLVWQRLPDGHPAKTAAVLDAAQHWALRLENNQTAMAEASQAISAAVDWSAVGIEYLSRRRFRATRPWADRAVIR